MRDPSSYPVLLAPEMRSLGAEFTARAVAFDFSANKEKGVEMGRVGKQKEESICFVIPV